MTIMKLCLNLAKAETIQELERILENEGYLNSDDYWHPFGNDPANYRIIGNQASDSIRPLVEKCTNSIDQLLILEWRIEHYLMPDSIHFLEFQDLANLPSK